MYIVKHAIYQYCLLIGSGWLIKLLKSKEKIEILLKKFKALFKNI